MSSKNKTLMLGIAIGILVHYGYTRTMATGTP